MDIVDLVKKLIAGPLTEAQAVAICRTVGEVRYGDYAGAARLTALVPRLNQTFPQFKWRFILCDRPHMYWAITIHDLDLRQQKETR